MMNKVLSSLAVVGVFGIIGYGYLQANYLQDRFASFVAKGPRFTAQDGQELCEALREVAKYSIGFQQSGKPMPECNYVTRNK